MTELEFLKKRFQPFGFIEYKNDRELNIDGGTGVIVECILLAIDFDERLLKLIPIPKSWHEEEPFWARCENCEIAKPKLKIVKN